MPHYFLEFHMHSKHFVSNYNSAPWEKKGYNDSWNSFIVVLIFMWGISNIKKVCDAKSVIPPPLEHFSLTWIVHEITSVKQAVILTISLYLFAIAPSAIVSEA